MTSTTPTGADISEQFSNDVASVKWKALKKYYIDF